MNSGVAFAAAFAVSVLFTFACRTLALRFGFVARPKADRWHTRPTALLGGVAIACTTLGLHALFGFGQLPILFWAAAAIFVIGLVDDLASLKPATKLVFEI